LLVVTRIIIVPYVTFRDVAATARNVTSKALQQYTLNDFVQVLAINLIRTFLSEERTTWLHCHCNLARALLSVVLPMPPGTYKYAFI
jgi:hypothetical protein